MNSSVLGAASTILFLRNNARPDGGEATGDCRQVPASTGPAVRALEKNGVADVWNLDGHAHDNPEVEYRNRSLAVAAP